MTRPVIDLCLAEEWITGPRMSKWWWEQDGVDVEGIQTAAWDAEHIEGEKYTYGAETETN